MKTLRLIGTLSPEGEQKVLPGAIVAKAALASSDAAILEHDVLLGAERVLARGTVLHVAADIPVSGLRATVFCETPRIVPGDKMPTLSKVPGALEAPPPRQCLFDADANGKFDHAFSIGLTRPLHAVFVISPTAYGRIDNRPLGSTSIAQLRYLGPVQTTDSVGFELEAYLEGWKCALPHPRTVVSVARLPAYGLVGTAVVTILAYDKPTRTATIRMDHGLAPGHILVPELNRGH